MVYSDLRELWSSYRSKGSNAYHSMLKAPGYLIKSLNKILIPDPPCWVDKNSVEYKYIDIYSKNSDGKFEGLSAHKLSSMYDPGDGKLKFYLGLTMDHGANTWPKNTYMISVVVGFFDEKIQYGFLVEDTGDIIEQTDSSDSFANLIVSKLEELFCSNPMGVKSKNNIGFEFLEQNDNWGDKDK